MLWATRFIKSDMMSAFCHTAAEDDCQLVKHSVVGGRFFLMHWEVRIVAGMLDIFTL